MTVKKISLLVLFSLCSVIWSDDCFAFEITEPTSGSVFHPGDKVTVRAVAAQNENPVAYFIFTSQMPFSAFGVLPPYELTFTIPLEFTGSDKIVASAKFSDGNIVETEVQMQVVLPANITLQGIKIDPDDFILLKKLPPDSDPNDVRIAETDYISVSGLYSDGVKRWIASSADGTTYTSSDETIVTVDSEGKVTAQGLGEAKITVKNGNYSATVDVIVKPYE
ncbi:bacterial Ig-like domain [bacterium BMS3Abin10]|nr:bacterial Ig-like domain [bacterium BMS3Abin10]